MINVLPIWILPFWTLGVPLVWAIMELARLPKRSRDHPGRPVYGPVPA